MEHYTTSVAITLLSKHLAKKSIEMALEKEARLSCPPSQSIQLNLLSFTYIQLWISGTRVWCDKPCEGLLLLQTFWHTLPVVILSKHSLLLC